jgi:hypothetical protein
VAPTLHSAGKRMRGTLGRRAQQVKPNFRDVDMRDQEGELEQQRAAAAYCRVSTLEPKRRGHGIDIRIRDVTLFAPRQGIVVSESYRDEAERGVKENRRALQRLLRDCRRGKVATIILPSLDRLSRNVRMQVDV